ncbi:glycosyl transferase family 1 [Longibacter salinarum]|uniref:Glycosyl transferase family 1 n=1 Tax=Longibacter salinarum TaxID=1850348 RepID=A0A2A8CW59_9BACT|nr:glycosyltransferase family 4 protein [Longibacter salinarum]PEN12824.1 glycosyl transferase family 1 [Longibacter salinarum]
MNVLLVAQRYHPYVGGVETQTRLVMNELAKRDHVEVAAAQFDDVDLPKRLGVLEDSLFLPSATGFDDGDVTVHALTPSLMDRLRMLPIATRAIPRLGRYKYHALRRFGYPFFRRVYEERFRQLMKDVDVVHSIAGGYLGWTAQHMAQQLDIPFVVTPYVHPGQHGDDPDSVAYYRRSDAVLALLETDQEMLVNLGVARDRIHLYGVVPLLPPTSDGSEFRRQHDLGDRPVVLFVGRMVEYKGVKAMEEAAPIVWKRNPDVQFVFVGPVSDDAKERLSSTDPRLHVLGFVSKQEKADAYAACDIFCMPSKFEILPAVYLEAWSYGKPVIGGPAHGLDALIEGNDGGIVVDQTATSVAEGISFVLDHPDRSKQMGENGRMLVQNKFSVDSLVDKLEAVYQSVQNAPSTWNQDQSRNAISV